MFLAIIATTGGFSAVITTILNYILSTFLPSVESSIIAVVGIMIGFYSAGTISVRVLRGWGISLSGH